MEKKQPTKKAAEAPPPPQEAPPTLKEEAAPPPPPSLPPAAVVTATTEEPLKPAPPVAHAMVQPQPTTDEVRGARAESRAVCRRCVRLRAALTWAFASR